MTHSDLRFARFLLASPRTLRAEMDALAFERRELAPRWFNEADVTALCKALWGCAPATPFARPPHIGTASLDAYESEVDSLRGSFGASWAWRFWDAEAQAWCLAPTRRGLQQVDMSWWEDPSVGRDGRGSGSRIVRLFDHAADWIVLFSVETHQRVVFSAGSGVPAIRAAVDQVLGR